MPSVARSQLLEVRYGSSATSRVALIGRIGWLEELSRGNRDTATPELPPLTPWPQEFWTQQKLQTPRPRYPKQSSKSFTRLSPAMTRETRLGMQRYGPALPSSTPAAHR